MLDEKTAYERLVDYFPKWKQQGIYTHAYHHLVKCFCDLINSDEYMLDEKKEALKNARENYNHMCENDTKCVEMKKEEDLKIERENREEKYRKLHENHLEFIKKTS
jgi:hypothetical protein